MFDRQSLRRRLPTSDRLPMAEPLEARQLMAVTPSIGIYLLKNASETSPSTTGMGQYYIKRSGATTSSLTVKYRYAGGSTATRADFAALPYSVTIAKGRDKTFINVTPVNDSLVEGTELLNISVDTGNGYTIDAARRFRGMNIADNDSPSSGTDFSAPIDVAVGSTARTDKVVNQDVNFTTLLTNAGKSGSIVDNSVRVVEVNGSGTVTNANVPFQFDKSSTYNAATNASGTIVFLMSGSTAASATRHFKVQFSTAGSFTAPSVTPLVTTVTGQVDEGGTGIAIDSQNATYFLQDANGGFSTLLDKSNNHNDWLDFHPNSGSFGGGEFRGTPNSIFPGGGFHPGFVEANVVTTVVNSGPLKSTIDVAFDVNKKLNSGDPDQIYHYKMRYEIYPTYVHATMLEAGSSYWFLYEGTPGGAVGAEDTVVRSDGAVTNLSDPNAAFQTNIGAGNGEEWAYVRDSTVDKFIFYAHDVADAQPDSYATLSAGNAVDGSGNTMTVLGFGRDNTAQDPNREKLTGVNGFTFGLADGGSNFSTAATTIEAAYKSVSSTLGAIS